MCKYKNFSHCISYIAIDVLDITETFSCSWQCTNLYFENNMCIYIYILHNIVHAIIKNRVSLHQKKKIIINRECRIKFVRLNPYK